MSYLRTHWTGQQAFVWSFWVNFVLICLTINLVGSFIRPPDSDRSWFSLLLVLVYLIAGHLVIYAWQVIGLLRSCHRHIKQGGDFIMVTAAQVAVVISMMAGLVTVAATLHSIFGSSPETAAEAALADAQARTPNYQLEQIAGGSLIRIDGEFEIGLSRDLEELLAQEPNVRGIVLDSDGGRVFEARGVAKLIGEYQLQTYVYRMCQSACTTAFIAGAKRFLGKSGRLGFHRYSLEAAHPFIDAEVEQQKDQAFYRSQGVAPALVSRIFTAPHQSMWYPEADILLNASAVHQIIEPHRE